MKKNLLLLLLAAVLIVTNYGCQDETGTVPPSTVNVSKPLSEYKHDVVTDWNEKFLSIERYATGCRPGPAPRALAYIGLAMYEGCIKGMPEYNSLASHFTGLSLPQQDISLEYHYPTVINNIYSNLLFRLFQNVQFSSSTYLDAEISTLRNRYNNDFQAELSTDVFTRSKAYGEAIAEAVYQWSATDIHGHEAYLDPFRGYDYTANAGHGYGYTANAGLWTPTSTGGNGMFNYWGQARTFAINDNDKLCLAPLPYSEDPTSHLYVQALEVYARTTNYSNEDHWIAEFWSDDLTGLTFSPPPRWIAIADQVYKQQNATLETAVYANAKVGLALNDAGVACWYSKYYYNVERPISYIHRVIDPNWTTRLRNPNTQQENITPSFPAYPSGHSTFGAAAAEVLTDIFGINYAMTDNCHANRSEFYGTPRAFESFYDMAWENAISRVPLGVHFRMDCQEGYNLGIRCGRKVNRLNWKG